MHESQMEVGAVCEAGYVRMADFDGRISGNADILKVER